MAAPSFLPVLTHEDVERAAQLIQQAYAPQNHLSSEDQDRLQRELFEIQKRPEAWGLVVPFLNYTDPNVQFFGAHTAQVKIARDWSTIPEEHVLALRDMILEVTGQSIAQRRSKVILRKLFVAITSLALKIYPTNYDNWPEWLISCIQTLSNLGAPNEHLLDFLAIAAQEVQTADLVALSKKAMERSLLDAVPMVVQAITLCISRPREERSSSELTAALKCLESWITVFPASNLTPLVPTLISLLDPISDSQAELEFDETVFVAASDSLQEVMSSSVLSSGAGTRTVTEPLLLWCDRYGGAIVSETLKNGSVDAVSHSFCKLLAAMGDHSTMYFSSHLSSTSQVPAPVDRLSFPLPPSLPTRSYLVQNYLRLLLAYTALPGYYGVDEEESELTLGFWYLFQEALWSVQYDVEYGVEETSAQLEEDEKGRFVVAKAVYSELVRVLRGKVVWPRSDVLNSWTKDDRDKFQQYRRDVGDTLINAYYILRDDMLAYYINDTIERLDVHQPHQGWEDIEGNLYCVMAIQEAIPLEPNAHLSRTFGPEILGRLPLSGAERIRRTALLLVGSYASWFTTEPAHPPGSSAPSLLMSAISYVVAALPEPALCLQAADALRDLCDANRTALAPHIAAFGELHAGLTGIPDSEKAKVLQSIASVIQALPPLEEIPPIEAIVSPVISKLFQALQSSSQLPDEARAMAIQQLETISGVARGLTRTTDSLLVLDDAPEVREETERMRVAREDPRMAKLREAILGGVTGVVEVWSTDASVSDALSELFKAITALPSDLTLLSLPPAPLLSLICVAAKRQLTAVWLSLATMLLIQLDPPTLIPTTFKATTPSAESRGVVLEVLGVLLQTSLSVLGQAGAMESNPDIVQAFFNCMNTMAQHFTAVFFQLPSELFDALMQCAISALALQERYSLVSACTFLGTLVNRTATTDELSAAKALLVERHGGAIMAAVLVGFAGVTPRSATQNLIEMLSTLVTRFPAESRAWMMEILYSEEFTRTQTRVTNELKDRFVKAVFGSRSVKRTREAAQHFTLIARGLEGSNFGYASGSM